MRFLFAASLISVVAAAATFACSSSNPVAPVADAGKDAKASQQTTDDDDDQPTDTIDSGGTTSNEDAGDAATTDATSTTTGDAGAACQSDSQPETEPNETEATATKLTPNAEGAISFCGRTTDGDTDVFTFKHPFNGGFTIESPKGDNVTYKTKIGNQTFNGFPQNVSVSANDIWFITVTTNNPSSRSYAVRIKPD